MKKDVAEIIDGDLENLRRAVVIELLPKALLTAHRAPSFDNSRAESPFELIAKLDGDIFEITIPPEKLPTWFRATLAEIYRQQA